MQANEGIKEAMTAVGDLVRGLNETFGRRERSRYVFSNASAIMQVSTQYEYGTHRL